jgi:hypothetical protein
MMFLITAGSNFERAELFSSEKLFLRSTQQKCQLLLCLYDFPLNFHALTASRVNHKNYFMADNQYINTHPEL